MPLVHGSSRKVFLLAQVSLPNYDFLYFISFTSRSTHSPGESPKAHECIWQSLGEGGQKRWGREALLDEEKTAC